MMKNNIPAILRVFLFSIVFGFASNAVGQNGWTTAAPMTSARYGMAMGVIDGKIYVAGGYGTTFENTLEVYDPAMNTWTTLAPMPAAQYFPFADVIGGKLSRGGSLSFRVPTLVGGFV